MADPIPFVVAGSGDSADAPSGAVPIDLFGAGGDAVPNATPTTKGIVNQAAALADSTATDVDGLKADYNTLLARLRTAGILA